MSCMYGIGCVPFCSENRLSKILFSNPFPKNSQIVNLKLRIGFDPKNPPRVLILWIHDPFLDLPPPKRKIRFWIRKFGFGFSPQKGPIYVKACYSHDNSLGQAVPGGVMVKYVFKNYSPKAKLILLNNPRDDYSTILTEPELNNCFSIFTRSDLNRISKGNH